MVKVSLVAAAAARIAGRRLAEAPAVAIDDAVQSARPQLPRHLEERLVSTDAHSASKTRQLQPDPSPTCDAAFLKCILSPTCRGCFTTLQEHSIDWANVVPETPCQDVLGFLVASGHCQDVRNGGANEQETFCGAFDSCVVWDEDDAPAGSKPKKEGDAADEESDEIDCSTLTECQWEGMHERFLGDGVCHDAMPGCYNSKACNYDGGDCCEDTCHYPGGGSANSNWDEGGECGMEGYACRDPGSANCKPALAREAKEFCASEENSADTDFDDDVFTKEEDEPDCGSSEFPYRLVQYDSWGDGWDATVLTLTEQGKDAPIYKGGLEYGSQGTVHVCLSKLEAKCYHVTVENGVWGNEISWELRPLAAGAPVLAAGGSPTDCTVPLGGAVDSCDNTCDKSRPDTKVTDPNYKSYKDMESCIEQKCLIQVGNCAKDEGCSECMQESSPDYCFANENFNTLIDCSMCSCTDSRPAYCDAKASGNAASSTSGSSAATHEGNLIPKKAGGSSAASSTTGGAATCAPEQTLKGTSSLVKFSECADVDQLMAMVTDFDNDNFGQLDVFESCAHTYDEEPMHGGKNALDCMKILHSLIVEDEDETSSGATFKNSKGEPLSEGVSKAISTLAQHLYHDAESFCECTASVNKEAPQCSSFVNFKTLLFEALDACRSLDAIDCAAWEEFTKPCKENLLDRFDKVDFTNREQCGYVEKQCGGAGPFPAFRRMDCGSEIAKSSWDFYQLYARECLKETGEVPTPTPPTPGSPSSPSYSSPTAKKQYKPYSANGDSDEKKPYGSEEKKPYYKPSYKDGEPEEDTDNKYTEKKKHHFVRNSIIVMALAVAGFVWHKKRRENFNYMRFRQLREARNYAGGLNVGGGAGGEYVGVSMADTSSFEPPTLPPTPSDNTTMI
ncbi:hypothetical protein ACHAXT_000723 [Thalassiosira profunda]